MLESFNAENCLHSWWKCWADGKEAAVGKSEISKNKTAMKTTKAKVVVRRWIVRVPSWDLLMGSRTPIKPGAKKKLELLLESLAQAQQQREEYLVLFSVASQSPTGPPPFGQLYHIWKPEKRSLELWFPPIENQAKRGQRMYLRAKK